MDSRPAQVLTGSIRLPGAQYQEPARIDAFWDELRRRVAALPGVAGVAYADGLPPNQPGQHNNFDLESDPGGRRSVATGHAVGRDLA